MNSGPSSRIAPASASGVAKTSPSVTTTRCFCDAGRMLCTPIPRAVIISPSGSAVACRVSTSTWVKCGIRSTPQIGPPSGGGMQKSTLFSVSSGDIRMKRCSSFSGNTSEMPSSAVWTSWALSSIALLLSSTIAMSTAATGTGTVTSSHALVEDELPSTVGSTTPLLVSSSPVDSGASPVDVDPDVAFPVEPTSSSVDGCASVKQPTADRANTTANKRQSMEGWCRLRARPSSPSILHEVPNRDWGISLRGR